jgi:hypothetical protein
MYIWYIIIKNNDVGFFKKNEKTTSVLSSDSQFCAAKTASLKKKSILYINLLFFSIFKFNIFNLFFYFIRALQNF